MKKRLICFLFVLLFCAGAVIPCYGASSSFHWYCVHVKDHVQPSVGREMAFVEELDGYYIDHRHSDPNDAEKVVYLTFDAGYENGNIAKILDVLKEEEVPAAFFILGNLITKNTDLVKRMVEEGHTVGNHTVHHRDMSGVGESDFLKELEDLENLFREQTGYTMSNYYRPPEGCFSRENLEVAQKNGYKTVFWSFAYPDWDNNKQMSEEKAKTILLENLHNGEVMLLHPTSSTNAQILSEIIREMKAQGYRFGRLDELVYGSRER
ncbi:MAG: polysaccharide deacetylase family protein [Clostridia bacterium]|nr:polysaccharide deacetylase family protein [Clostridia bacterium]